MNRAFTWLNGEKRGLRNRIIIQIHLNQSLIVLSLQVYSFYMLRPIILAVILALFSLRGFGQGSPVNINLVGDTVRLLSKDWRMANGDNPAWRAVHFNDSSWISADPEIPRGSDLYKTFSGLAWFRLHFTIDSSSASFPLALQLSQKGTSEVYLDGVLLPIPKQLNTDTRESRRENPRLKPYVFSLSPGLHVLAVRYDYKEFKEEARKYQIESAGFSAQLVRADDFNSNQMLQNILATIGSVLLITLFVTVGLTHFFHFAFDPGNRSNLMLGLFCLCLALFVMVPYLLVLGIDPLTQLQLFRLLIPTLAIAALSFSGFMNELFGSRKRFYWIAGCGLISILIWLIFNQPIAILIFALLASLEGLIVLAGALLRRAKGSFIIASGMLLLPLTILGVILFIYLTGKFHVSANPGAVIVILLLIGIFIIPLSMSAFLAWNFARVNKDLKFQLVQVNQLSEKNLQQEKEKQKMLEDRSEELEREVAARTVELQKQKQKSDDLLHNILPQQVAEELKNEGRYEARQFEEVSVLFTDFVNFTQYSEGLSPADLIHEIDLCFQAFDRIIERHGLEKIKTVGDAYIAVAGLPVAKENHAEIVVQAALDIRDFMLQRQKEKEGYFAIRIGVHSGPVVAGIVGLKKYAYDIWGDTVNTAARMEQHSEAGRINISNATFKLLGENFYCTPRGIHEVKHKGKQEMFFVEGLKKVNAV